MSFDWKIESSMLVIIISFFMLQFNLEFISLVLFFVGVFFMMLITAIDWYEEDGLQGLIIFLLIWAGSGLIVSFYELIGGTWL